MTFAEFWPRRREHGGDEVRIRGKAVFDLECPPPDAGGDCEARGYLTSPETDTFRAHEQKEALLLHEGGSVVRCNARTQLGLECRGWRQGTQYVVRGVVRPSTGGEPPGEFVIEVREKEVA